jgi:peptidoglycan hydrolase CwlO-like protein
VAVFALTIPAGLGTVAPASAAPAPDPAGAQARVDAARRETEAVTSRYFQQLDRYEVVGSEIAATEQRMADIREQASGLQVVVARRALRAYKSGGSVDFVLDGTGISDITRGSKLLAVANARDDDAVAQLGILTDDLQARRAELERSREEQSAALEELKAAQRKVDGNLRAALADQQSVTTRLEAQAAADRAAKQAAAAAANPQSSSTTGRTAVVAPVVVVPPVIDYTPNGGSHPHHDDPFLSCTRARESRGNYSVVNPSGPYLGAYQFLQSTWNITAQHAGRAELVGVPPNAASAFDQDDVAWTLYQWQGTGPWGGAC